MIRSTTWVYLGVVLQNEKKTKNSQKIPYIGSWLGLGRLRGYEKWPRMGKTHGFGWGNPLKLTDDGCRTLSVF